MSSISNEQLKRMSQAAKSATDELSLYGFLFSSAQSQKNQVATIILTYMVDAAFGSSVMPAEPPKEEVTLKNGGG